MPLLTVEGLQKRFSVTRPGLLGRRAVGTVRAVDDVSFEVAPGEVLGMVGESGCGKTTLARALLHLVPPTAGRVWLDGTEASAVFAKGGRAEVLRLRRRMQYVFQDPYLSLNPRWTIGRSIAEPLRVHALLPAREHRKAVSSLLAQVGLEAATAGRAPHELSGGQRQRVGIARALAVSPALLICDEPVSSLDVSVRAQILNLLAELRDAHGLALLYISHDLSSVRFISRRVAVMYLGRIIEIAPADALFAHPRHHYTAALLAAIPVPDPDAPRGPRLAGEIPSPLALPTGCRFHPRCPAATAICRAEDPPLAGGVACHHPR